MEAGAAQQQVSERELREARQGFMRILRAKRMHPRFVAAHADELLARAQEEYAAWLSKGEPAENPPGWIIHCAWRRTQDLLDAERRRPRAVALEDVEYLAEDRTPGPEAQLLDHDRHEQLMRAMSELDDKDREMLKLTFFEEMTVIEAGKRLGFGKSSADRHQKAALKSLHELLDGAIDVPAVEIGLAAWIGATLDHGWLLRLESLPAALRDGSLALAGRAEAVGRRSAVLTDPANASLTGPLARTAGACAGAAAAICLASGAVGPGLGAVTGGVREVPVPKVKTSRPARDSFRVVKASPAGLSEAAPRPASPSSAPTTRQSASAPAAVERSQRPAEPSASPRQPTPRTTSQKSAAEFGLEGSPAPTEPESAPSPAPEEAEGTSPPTVKSRSAAPSPSGGSGSGSSGKSAASEFGL